MQDIFTKIYETNYWSGRQSRSGSGSDLEETVNIRRELPKLFERLEVKSMLDIPCGDLNWMKEVKLPKDFRYIGADIVPEMIDKNINNLDYFEDGWFDILDITKNELPQVDLIFTRDCLGHLSYENVEKAVDNIWRAQPKYFVTTHWPEAKFKNIVDGSWRPINMNDYLDDSFALVELIEEDIKGKYLAVYELS